MSIDVDQATVDRWRADGRWVMFGEGEPCPEGTHGGVVVQRSPHHEPELEGPCELCQGNGYRPPVWMVEAAKLCETCDGVGSIEGRNIASWDLCPDCSNGKRRLAITVPCDVCGRWWVHGKKCLGITVPELAVVEWGPLRVVGFGLDGDDDYVRLSDGTKATPPPDIDPQSLIGQWAIGGRIEVGT